MKLILINRRSVQLLITLIVFLIDFFIEYALEYALDNVLHVSIYPVLLPEQGLHIKYWLGCTSVSEAFIGVAITT